MSRLYILQQMYCLFCLFCIPSSSALLSTIHNYNNNIHLSCLQFSPRSSNSVSNKEEDNAINNNNSKNKRKVYDLEVIDLEDLHWYDDRKDPPATVVASMKRVLDDGLTAWSVIRHGVSDDAVKEAMEASRVVFAQLVETKRRRYAVGYMDRSRGWEMYPHHVKFQKRECTPSWDGILCERYVMGPPSVCKTPPEAASFASDPYYASDFGRVFYERNRWPNNDDDGHRLKKAMHAIYHPLYRVSAASMRVLAVALGAPSWNVFDSMIVDPDVPASLCPSNNSSFASSPLRHHSRLQINHYPKIPDNAYDNRRKLPFRANAHLDTSLLTVLARELNDGMSAGALEIQDNERFWRVPSLPGSLTVEFGSLIEYFTHSKNCCHGATHRVTTPKRGGSSSSRCSIGFVLKPDYTARAQPPYSERIHHHDAAPNTNPIQHNDDDVVFPVALLGCVGWQNHAMIFEGKTRAESIAAFKPRKNEMRRRRFG